MMVLITSNFQWKICCLLLYELWNVLLLYIHVINHMCNNSWKRELIFTKLSFIKQFLGKITNQIIFWCTFSGKIALAVVSALHYLHTKLKVIHRDVKPSNILINRKGQVKMCDFGISGYLVDSVAKTIDAGCKPYMAVSIFFFFICCVRFYRVAH